ncbi:PAS-domain containing protein [Phaeovibrio sulfidiphilus]|uniref:PAS-domain containing protein n=1 Tax=Phaeovibrio sulfidiphilus TaxID=1220600 RepID=A0A8J6YYT6_9PROT|nr:PAS-domain containing protein [Phaeovibrio sulfidiphilus]
MAVTGAAGPAATTPAATPALAAPGGTPAPAETRTGTLVPTDSLVPFALPASVPSSWIVSASILVLCLLGVGLSLLVSHRRARTKALQHSRKDTEDLRELLATCPDGLFLWRSEGGTAGPGKTPGTLTAGGGTTHCSRRLAVLLDLAAGEQASFKDILEHFSEDDARALKTAFEAVRSDARTFTLELGDTLSGRRIRITGQPVGTMRTKPYDAVLWMRDITREETSRERQNASLASLGEERDRLRGMLDALATPVWARNEELLLTECNAAFVRALDVPGRTQALASRRELVDGTAALELRALAAGSRARMAPARGRFHAVVEGERRLFEVTERPVGVGTLHRTTVGQAIDISAIEEVEDRLENEIDTNAAVLERLTSGVAFFSADTQLRFFNRAWARLWKLDPRWLETGPDYGDVLERLREGRRLPEVADFPAYKAGEIAFFTRMMSPKEEILHLPDGATLRRVVAAHPLGGLIITTEDVTDSLAKERAYSQISTIFGETIGHLREGVALFDANGVLHQASPAFGLFLEIGSPLPPLTIMSFLERMLREIRSGADAAMLRDHLNARSGDASLMLRSGRIVNYQVVPLSDGGWMMLVE